MPGQYYLYVPFDTDGDLKAGIDIWIQNTHQMAHTRGLFLAMQNKMAATSNEGERDDLKGKLNEFAEREKKDKHGDVGLDKRKKPTRINHYDTDDRLAVLRSLHPHEYTLYVIGHCTQGSTVIFNKSPKLDAEEITASALVERMKADGLPQTAFNIKLLACYGACQWENNPSFMEQFVANLQKYLKRAYIRGYKEPVLLSQFYADQHKATKKAAFLPDGTINNIKVRPDSLSATKFNLAIGRDEWPRCSLGNCNEAARFKCGSCNDTFYCSKEHQRADYPSHFPDRCLD
ncbi:MAG TPA: zinc finger MYND domain-containing protein [Telluria sp.]|jgi:hypothetical protein